MIEDLRMGGGGWIEPGERREEEGHGRKDYKEAGWREGGQH